MTASKKKQQKKRKKQERQRWRDEAELVGARVAYESGVHWLDANVRALEALRTRSLALVSVVLIAATVMASLAPDAVKQDTLGFCGWVGAVTVALGMATVFVTSACVSWPAKLIAELGPLKIIEKHVDPSLTWPSAELYKALATDLDGYAKQSRETLRVRAQCLSVGIVAAGTAVVGFALFWADATF